MMEQYELFSEQNFLNDPFFQDWVLFPDEKKNLFWQNFISSNPQQKEVVESARKILKNISFKEDFPGDAKIESSLNDVLLQINAPEKKARVVQFHSVYRLVSVAAIFILIVIGGYLLVRKKPSTESIAKTTNTINKQNDIAAGGNKAILTLADGRKIVLDSTQNGALTNQGGVMVTKNDGELSYQGGQQNDNSVVYNIISTPKGGQYQLVLADGTKVWLNAASSLKYPTAFNGNDRVVELNGEGYFEVAHNASKPFHVKVNDMYVRVLGTHFNINSYSDEPSIKTTLLEGRVMVKKGDKFVYLNPGQQAVTTTSKNDLRVQSNVDVDEVIAWKNGKFSFNSADIRTIMRQAARWYDVDVVYEGTTGETFSGNPSRSENISQLLKILEATGKVQFEIKDKQVIVKAK